MKLGNWNKLIVGLEAYIILYKIANFKKNKSQADKPARRRHAQRPLHSAQLHESERSRSIKFTQILSFDEKIVTIGPVDPEIIGLKLKKKKLHKVKFCITNMNVHVQVSGKFAERAKKGKIKK